MLQKKSREGNQMKIMQRLDYSEIKVKPVSQGYSLHDILLSLLPCCSLLSKLSKKKKKKNVKLALACYFG